LKFSSSPAQGRDERLLPALGLVQLVLEKLDERVETTDLVSHSEP
jgi:hypothetical protein